MLLRTTAAIAVATLGALVYVGAVPLTVPDAVQDVVAAMRQTTGVGSRKPSAARWSDRRRWPAASATSRRCGERPVVGCDGGYAGRRSERRRSRGQDGRGGAVARAQLRNRRSRHRCVPLLPATPISAGDGNAAS